MHFIVCFRVLYIKGTTKVRATYFSWFYLQIFCQSNGALEIRVHFQQNQFLSLFFIWLNEQAFGWNFIKDLNYYKSGWYPNSLNSLSCIFFLIAQILCPQKVEQSKKTWDLLHKSYKSSITGNLPVNFFKCLVSWN